MQNFIHIDFTNKLILQIFPPRWYQDFIWPMDYYGGTVLSGADFREPLGCEVSVCQLSVPCGTWHFFLHIHFKFKVGGYG